MKEAINNNDLNELNKLLEAGADINSTDHCDGVVPLIYAAKCDRLDIVNLLLDSEHIDVNVTCKKGHTMLMWLASRNYVSLSKKILKFPSVKVNAKDNFGITALMYAALDDYLNVARVLLSHSSIDVNVKDNRGNSALICAAIEGSLSVVKALLESPEIDVNAKGAEGRTALLFAVSHGHEDIVNQILSHPDTDVNVVDENNNSAFIIASGNGNANIVRLLLKFKDVNFNLRGMNNYNALIWAVYLGRTHVVKILSESESIDLDVKDDESKPIWMAACENNLISAVSLIANKIKRAKSSNIKDILFICKSAPSNILEYLMYSGFLLSELPPSINIFNIHRSDILFMKMQSSVYLRRSLNLGNQDQPFPRRMDLLIAKIRGVNLQENINVFYSGMSLPNFLWVSALMRSAKLTKIAYYFNPYMFMYMLLLRDNIGSYLDKLPFELKIEVMNFVSAEDFSPNIKDLPPVEEVLPKTLQQTTSGYKKISKS